MWEKRLSYNEENKERLRMAGILLIRFDQVDLAAWSFLCFPT